MKQYTRIWVLFMGLMVVSTVAVLAGNSPAATSDKEPSKDKSKWYEKAAETIGPVDGLDAKRGSLLTLQEGSGVYMEGNSSLHKYQMNAHALEGSAVLKGSPKDLAKAMKAGKVGPMTFIVPVSAFKSSESGLDKNAYKALKSKENPVIKFVLTSETLKAGKEAGSYVMTAKGTLAVAGETIPIILTAETTIKDGRVRLMGVQKLKFTDFKIKPPSATLLVFTVTCTDEFEVHYDVTFAAPAAASRNKV